MDLNEKSVLITGGGRGLGRALAPGLAQAGARVVIAARNSDEIRSVVNQIREGGGIAYAIPADLGEKTAIHPLAAQAAALAGSVDILINNASVLGPVPLRQWMDTDCEDLEVALAANLVGPFRLTKSILGSMLIRGGGLVLNLSSDAAVSAYPTWGAYSVTKAALDHLTRIWAAELEGSPVKLLSLDPGEMDTRMHTLAMPEADPSTLEKPEVVAARIVELIRASPTIENGNRIIVSEWARRSSA